MTSASSPSSRWPAAYFSATRRSAGSATPAGSGWAIAACIASAREFADGEGHVVSAEPEAVADGSRHLALHGLVGRVVEIAFGVGRPVVDRGRHDPFLHRERADDELHSS